MTDRKVGVNTGNRGKGRPKGAKNKTTVAAKAAIEMAAERLGGVDRMVAWAQEDPANERVFWSQLYTKLLPLQVEAQHDVSDSLSDLLTAVALSGKRIGS